MNKKKILITLAHYLPGTKVGGPVSSVKNIAEKLSGFFDIYILTSDRDFNSKTPYSDLQTKKWLNQNGYNVFYIDRDKPAIFQIYRQIREVRPDVIYLNPFFDPIFSSSIVFAYKFGLIKVLKIIVAPRGELFEVSLNFKRQKKALFLKLVNIFGIYSGIKWHATSHLEMEAIAKVMQINVQNILVARVLSENLINTPKCEMSSHLSIEKLHIVYLARISKDKNTPYCFKILKKVTLSLVFDIYGPLEDQDIWDECLELSSHLPPNIEFRYKGIIKKEDVRSTLSKYDLFFMPTFSENYGHSIAESLSVGTPVLISDNTPWRNLQKKGLGWDINLSNADLFIKAIYTLGDSTPADRMQSRKLIKAEAKRILNDPEILNENIALFSI